MPRSPQHVKLARKLQKRLADKSLDPALKRFLQHQLKLVRALARLPSTPALPRLPALKGSPPHGQTPHTANINLKNPPPEASVTKRLLNQGRPPLKLKPFQPRGRGRLSKS